MKTTNCLNRHFLNAAFITSLFFGLTACNNNKQEDTKDMAEEHNESKMDNHDQKKDAQFLVDAAEINLMEIDLGNLAQKKAMMQETKDLGKMMVDEHTKAMNELKELAAKKTITIPTSATEDGQDKMKKFADKSGHDFDKDYCDEMVSGHKDAIDKFEKASNDANDPDIKAWAAATLPALRNHLDHAITCQEHCKNMK